jgi:hypothetical protein
MFMYIKPGSGLDSQGDRRPRQVAPFDLFHSEWRPGYDRSEMPVAKSIRI